MVKGRFLIRLVLIRPDFLIRTDFEMIYITGDCHGRFGRFMSGGFSCCPDLTENDTVIVCGDFGLLWAKGESFEQDCEFFAKQPFTLLWVQGNHENYNMIDEYPVEKWHGGKVRHIVRDKVILLERGQVFDIEGKRYFTFGGAQSHDISGACLIRMILCSSINIIWQWGVADRSEY